MRTNEIDDVDEPPASILGSLPRQRPGTRSPRREGRPASAGESEGSEVDSGKAGVPPGHGGETGQAGAPHAGGPDEPDAPERGLEDLAWAGIAVAAEAATLGVRVANRIIQAGTGWQKRQP